MSNKILLYKYCKLPDFQFWKAMLSKVKFSKLSFLNDPFEGFLKVRDESGNVIDQVPDDTCVASFSMVKPYSRVEKDRNKKTDDVIESNIYMWSHYADSLNGICIEYEVMEKNHNGVKAKEVTYITKHTEEISPFLKYKSWEFEQEYRLSISCKEKGKSEKYKENSEVGLEIKRIFIGVRLLGKDKKHKGTTINKKMQSLPIVIYLHEKYPHIPLYVCARHRSSFKIIKKDKQIWGKLKKSKSPKRK